MYLIYAQWIWSLNAIKIGKEKLQTFLVLIKSIEFNSIL